MTLVEDVLRYLQNDYPGGFPDNVWLINGGDSEVFAPTEVGTEVGSTVGSTSDGRSAKEDLARANLVTVKPADSDTPTPVGTEYDHKRGDPVDITVEGLHEDQRGRVADHDAFKALTRGLKRAVLSNRKFPTTTTGPRYYDLVIENEADQSSNFRDYYRMDFTVRFRGYDDLP